MCCEQKGGAAGNAANGRGCCKASKTERGGTDAPQARKKLKQGDFLLGDCVVAGFQFFFEWGSGGLKGFGGNLLQALPRVS